jgi:hypothetical protein
VLEALMQMGDTLNNGSPFEVFTSYSLMTSFANQSCTSLNKHKTTQLIVSICVHKMV